MTSRNHDNQHTDRGANHGHTHRTGWQHYEMHYIARKFGVAPSKVEEAMREVGDDRKKIEEYVQKRIRPNHNHNNHNNNHSSSR